MKRFYNKLTKSILNDKNFQQIINVLNSNQIQANKLIFSSTINQLSTINVKSDPILKTIFDFESTGRGDKRGKGELLLLFLIQGAVLSNVADVQIGGIDYEVKSSKKLSDRVTFGVQNTFTLTPFGIPLLTLFEKIKDAGANVNFRNQYPFWFDTNNGGGWKGQYRIEKLIGLEISEKSEFDMLVDEIRKLNGAIVHDYTNNVINFINDVVNFNTSFNNRIVPIVQFVDSDIYSTNAQFECALVTQSKAKMKLI